MNVLLFYNSNVIESALAHMIAKKYYTKNGWTITEKDTYGVLTGAIDTYIATLTADNYHKVEIFSEVAVTGATSKITYDQIASLRTYMATGYKGTTINEGTCQANSTSTNIKLAAAASAVDDFYNGNFIVTEGTTEVDRYITDYTGSSKVSVVADTSTAVTTTETYIVYSADYITYDHYANSKGAAFDRDWETM